MTSPINDPTKELRHSQKQINGLNFHVVEAGPETGPVCILLHGFPDFWFGWQAQIEALSQAGYHVVVPDQRGYNLTEGPKEIKDYRLELLGADILSLADAVGAKKFDLVGHDWGGVVAWWIGAQHPERIEHLAILNSPFPTLLGPFMRHHPSQLLKSWYLKIFQLPVVPEKLISKNDFALLSKGLRHLSSEEKAEYKKAWSKPGALTRMLNWYRAKRFETPINDRVLCRTSILWGGSDPYLETGLAEESYEVCERGQLHLFPGAGHWVQRTRAAEVNEALFRFFKE